jgi:hypothetical protein
MSSVFGKGKFGGNKRNWFKLKDGDSVYRILPPMGDLAEEGRWSQFWGIHYGYKNSKNETRTFQSPLVKNNKTKMVEVSDAALDRIDNLLARLDAARKAKDEVLVQELLKLAGGQKSRYNLDNNHYLNVIDLQGNIGILKIRHKAKLALDTAIKKLRADGIEPLDPETGRFFVFTRSGTNRDTLYQVTVYKKKFVAPGVGEVEQDVVHTITEDIAKRCVVVKGYAEDNKPIYLYKEAANLSTLFKKPTSAEVERMVKEGATAVDEILDSKASTTTVDEVNEDDNSPEDDYTSPPATVTTIVKATVTAVETTQPVVAEVGSTLSAPVKAEAKAAPRTTAETVADMSTEDFLKSLEQ